jgi:regulator of replication initiation timing
MNDNYFEKCQLLMNKISKQNKQIIKLQLDFADLKKENEELKQRNDRQAKRLGELYELMAKKDWESLTEIIDDFCSCEEQLQRESGTYGEWE